MQRQKAQKYQQNFGREVKNKVWKGKCGGVWMSSLTSLMNLWSPLPADLIFDGVLSPKTDLAACVLQAASAAESDPIAEGQDRPSHGMWKRMWEEITNATGVAISPFSKTHSTALCSLSSSSSKPGCVWGCASKRQPGCSTANAAMTDGPSCLGEETEIISSTKLKTLHRIPI